MKTNRPVFIGNFRSGTTLLVNLLGLHPLVAPWFETKALCEPLRWLRVLEWPEMAGREEDLIRLPGPRGFSAEAVAERMWLDFRDTSARMAGSVPSGKGGEERYPIGHDHALYTLEFAEKAVHEWLIRVGGSADPVGVAEATAELITGLGNRHASAADKPLWINKTPEITRFAPELRSCLGSVGILLMIRDGREVVRSATGLGWGAPKEMAGWWRGMIKESRDGCSQFEKDYMELRFEDLIDDPVKRVDQVLRFMGLPETGMSLVEHYRRDFPLRRPQSTRESLCPGGEYLDADLMGSLGYR